MLAAGIPVAAALSEILPGDNPEPGRDHLHKDGHQAGQADHPLQPVLELSAALEVSSSVTGVHITNTYQNRRANEGPPLFPETRLMMWNIDGAVHVLQRHVARQRSGGFSLSCRVRAPISLVHRCSFQFISVGQLIPLWQTGPSEFDFALECDHAGRAVAS